MDIDQIFFHARVAGYGLGGAGISYFLSESLSRKQYIFASIWLVIIIDHLWAILVLVSREYELFHFGSVNVDGLGPNPDAGLEGIRNNECFSVLFFECVQWKGR